MRHGRLSLLAGALGLAGAVGLALGCGGSERLPPPETPPVTRSSTNRVTAHASDGGNDDAVEAAVSAWIAREASAAWSHVLLSTVRCGDRLVAVVWPFGRGARIDDDDVLALPLRASDLAVVEEPWPARGRGAMAAHCPAGSPVIRRGAGVVPEALGSELIGRLGLVRDALAREDVGALREGIVLVAQLFEDDAVTSDGVADVVSDLARTGAEILSADVRAGRLHVIVRERPEREPRAYDLELVPVPGAPERVTIRLD